MWRRISHILIIQTDSTTAASCCVAMVWTVAVTGRSSGEEELLYLCPTEEWEGEETPLTAGLERIINPGVWSALTVLTPSVTITEGYPSPPPHPRLLSATEWQCMWTILLAFCPSIKSPLTNWSASTHLTPLSLNLFIQGSGLGSGSGLVLQCLCVLCRIENLLLFEKQSLLNRSFESVQDHTKHMWDLFKIKKWPLPRKVKIYVGEKR